jgi:hypothetical protein
MTLPRPAREARWQEAIGLLAVMVAAFVLRMSHFDTLLPWFYHEDEVRTVTYTLELLQNRTIDPGYDYYPALSFYINALAYLLWALPGELGQVIKHGPGALFDVFSGLGPTDPRLIMVSRWVSMAFGLATLLVSYLVFRLYLDFRWALFGLILLMLNPLEVSISVLAKNDAIAGFWFIVGLGAMVCYYRRGGYGWLTLAALGAGFHLVTKNNYLPSVFLGIALLLRGLARGRGLRGVITSPETWAGGGLLALLAFIGSPYTFLRLRGTLENVGWLYRQAEVISTYHTDPHVWWLDRYYYLFSIVLPFVFGLPVFWAVVAASVHDARQRFVNDPFILGYLLSYTYIFASQSGGPAGGAFAYYLFSHMLPLGILLVAQWLRDLRWADSLHARRAGLAVAAMVLLWGLGGVSSHLDMFCSGYDRLGPWLRANVVPDRKVLMVSVYKPAPALGLGEVKAIWPQDFTRELLDSYQPDVIVIDTWAVAGFRKVYREARVAPLVDTVLAGGDGYKVKYRDRIGYLGRSYFARLDPEHDVELIVAVRER